MYIIFNALFDKQHGDFVDKLNVHSFYGICVDILCVYVCYDTLDVHFLHTLNVHFVHTLNVHKG